MDDLHGLSDGPPILRQSRVIGHNEIPDGETVVDKHEANLVSISSCGNEFLRLLFVKTGILEDFKRCKHVRSPRQVQIKSCGNQQSAT